jgi:hypothetical protein
MGTARKLNWTIVLATAIGVGLWGATTRTALSRGGGGGHGGGHAGGHEGEHHEGEHHPYHPSEHHVASHEGEHHAEHHDENHHDDHHWDHHHHDWHYAGWGWNPGFWGGAAVGYGLGAWGDGGYSNGGTYIDNSNNPNASLADNTSSDDNAASNTADETPPSSDQVAQQSVQPDKMPVDVWPELGISTYSGEYGRSKGLVIVRVMPHSAGDKAGLVPGDVILSFNDQPTPDDEALEKVLDSAHGNFSLWVWDARTGRKSTITGALETASDQAEPKSTSE